MKELSLHILDLVQNSIKAQSKLIKIKITEDKKINLMCFEISDDGIGMDSCLLKNVINPFVTTRTTRKVGLGIPLTKFACEQAGGEFIIKSIPSKGTDLKATFAYDSIDRQPLGDIKSTILMLITGHEDINFVYNHKVEDKEFKLDTRELKSILGNVSFCDIAVYKWIDEYLKENIEFLYGG